MTRNERITDLLYKLREEEVINQWYYQSELEEAWSFKLIKKVNGIYVLDEKGLLLVLSGKTYEDFLDGLLPTNTPNANASTAYKPDTKPKASIFSNDYIKYTIIGIAVLIVWFFI